MKDPIAFFVAGVKGSTEARKVLFFSDEQSVIAEEYADQQTISDVQL